MLNRTRRSASLLSIVLFITAQSVAALDNPGYPPLVTAYDPRETAMLPAYCRFTQLFRDQLPGGNDRVQIDYWYSFMGTPFHAMHHYCWGLMKMNRALYLARSQSVRNHYFSDAVKEFDYVLANTNNQFVLQPEILTRKGRALLRLGKTRLAVSILEEAISIKPDYWPPYVELSDHYRQSGEHDAARSVIERALTKSPETRILHERLAELERGNEKMLRAPRPPQSPSLFPPDIGRPK